MSDDKMITNFTPLVRKVLSTKVYKSTSEISTITGLSPKLVIAILNDLESKGIVEHTIKTTKYDVKITMWKLVKRGLFNFSVRIQKKLLTKYENDDII